MKENGFTLKKKQEVNDIPQKLLLMLTTQLICISCKYNCSSLSEAGSNRHQSLCELR